MIQSQAAVVYRSWLFFLGCMGECGGEAGVQAWGSPGNSQGPYAERLKGHGPPASSQSVSFEDKATISFNVFAVFPSSKWPLCTLCSCFAISQVHYCSVWAAAWGQEGGCGGSWLSGPPR